jgi:hypothetical protein
VKRADRTRRAAGPGAGGRPRPRRKGHLGPTVTNSPRRGRGLAVRRTVASVPQPAAEPAATLGEIHKLPTVVRHGGGWRNQEGSALLTPSNQSGDRNGTSCPEQRGTSTQILAPGGGHHRGAAHRRGRWLGRRRFGPGADGANWLRVLHRRSGRLHHRGRVIHLLHRQR